MADLTNVFTVIRRRALISRQIARMLQVGDVVQPERETHSLFAIAPIDFDGLSTSLGGEEIFLTGPCNTSGSPLNTSLTSMVST